MNWTLATLWTIAFVIIVGTLAKIKRDSVLAERKMERVEASQPDAQIYDFATKRRVS